MRALIIFVILGMPIKLYAYSSTLENLICEHPDKRLNATIQYFKESNTLDVAGMKVDVLTFEGDLLTTKAFNKEGVYIELMGISGLKKGGNGNLSFYVKDKMGKVIKSMSLVCNSYVQKPKEKIIESKPAEEKPITDYEMEDESISKNDSYNSVSMCWAENKTSFSQCCTKFNVKEVECEKFGQWRAKEIADELYPIN